MPGTYDVNSKSGEESVVKEYIDTKEADILINIIDASSLERNLYLTLQLVESNLPVILALNFSKYSKNKGQKISLKKLSNLLNIPIVEIEAVNDVEPLKKAIINFKKKNSKIKPLKNPKKRYEKISQILKKVIVSKKSEKSLSSLIDIVVTNQYIGVPLFLLFMFFIFQFTYAFAQPFMNLVDMVFKFLGEFTAKFFSNSVLNSFISEGIIGGVGSVIIFLPNIMFMYLMLALLEDSGYLARAAYVMDRFMSKIGLQGNAFIPLVLGFGCNVPAIMATRILKNKKERLTTILMIPFMSCSARLAVFIMFAGVFFPKHSGLVVWSLYILGIIVAILTGLLINKFKFSSNKPRFIVELPPYRISTIKNVFLLMWDKSVEFLKTSTTIILSVVILIWFLSNLPYGVEYASQHSLIGKIGMFLSPIFKPLGFGDWRSAVALLFGFVAKEVVIGTFGTLYGLEGVALQSTIALNYSPLSAFSFLVFVLIYVPCMATVAVMRKETKSIKITFLAVLYSVALAWFLSFITYQGGLLLGLK